MLRDWEEMCPREWNEKWFKQNPAYQYTSDAMEMGNVFETMVIGMSVGQKVTTPSEKLKKSIFYERIKTQVEVAKEYLKSLGGKKLAVQEYLKAIVIDSEGQEVPICGNLDIRYGWPDEPLRMAVIDLKLTGDNENTFGKFAWGNIEHMDCSQAFQYHLLVSYNFPKITRPEFYYDVFDVSAKLKFTPFQIVISDYTLYQHIERLSKAYFEILDSQMFDSWKPIQQYNHCKACKCKCPYEVKIPSIVVIEK